MARVAVRQFEGDELSPNRIEESLGLIGTFVEESRSPLERIELGGNVDPRVLWPLLAAARCRRLVEAMLALQRAGLCDVVGVLARTNFEGWAAGMYALHGGKDAATSLAKDFKFYLDQFAKETGADLPDGPTWLKDIDAKQMSTKTLVNELHTKLAASQHPAAEYVENAYARLFRGESLRSTHGRVSAWLAHANQGESGGPVTILVVRNADDLASKERVVEAGILAAGLFIEAFDNADKPVEEELKSLAGSLGSPWYPPKKKVVTPSPGRR